MTFKHQTYGIDKLALELPNEHFFSLVLRISGETFAHILSLYDPLQIDLFLRIVPIWPKVVLDIVRAQKGGKELVHMMFID